MPDKISALTEVTSPNGTDMMVVVNSATTKKVQISNAVKAAAAIWARVYHNANQSIANSTVTALAFNSERADTNTIHDTATNNSRLTCQTAGVYSIMATAEFAANATGQRYVGIRLNGTTGLAYQRAPNSGASFSSILTVSTIYALSAADYVEVVVFQDSGSGLNVTNSGNYSPEFMMVRLGA